jgi:adenylate cyclase
MAEKRAQRRLAAILAADVVGYSRLMELDEAGTLAALKARRKEILQPLVAKHQGRIIKLMGDGVLVEFASAVDAVECAVELQKGMAAAASGEPEDRRIVLRVGINLGDVIVEGSDLYGDGVNIAARLQALAGPGETWIAGNIHEQIEKKLALSLEDLGPKQIKNIARPVRIFRVQAGTPAPLPLGSLSQPPSKPSIAVLPFVNLSGDVAQDYIVDGITENIITGLSRFHDLFVIASNSSFAYKGKAIKIQDVCRELGVVYVLEGSVQRSGDRMRIAAQLIEGATGRHLWAERYDRQGKDIFTLQDDVTQTIVGTLATAYGGRLGKAWQKRAGQADARNLEALDYLQRGMVFLNRMTKEDNKRARDAFGKAFELEANFGKPIAKLAWSHMIDATFGWSENADKSWESAQKFATMAVERDDDEAWGHYAMAGYYQYKLRQHDRAIAEYQKALALNPNDADVITDYAWCLSTAGRAEEAIEWALKAMRLNPHFPEWYVMQLGSIYYDARRYEDAITTLESLRDLETILTDLYLAASHAKLGHDSEAQKAIKSALKIEPEATIEKWTTAEKVPYKDPSYRENFREGLRKAGLPER